MPRRRKEAEEAEEKPYITRTARTLAATEINKVGMRLPDLKPEALDQLELPEELRDAIDMCQRMKTRNIARQKRLICRLLREEDHEAIIERVVAYEAARRLANKQD